ncbi:MAG: DUF3786 domain-containing protein [Armatimonadetes bacterium]|nr:DUF3786 domain-containing protein [Armatimonadota bacterium]
MMADDIRPDPYLPALVQAQRKLAERGLDTQQIARLAGARYDAQGAAWMLPALGRIWRISWPSLAVSFDGAEAPLDAVSRVSIINYLAYADGVPIIGEWVPWRAFATGSLALSAERPGHLPPLSDRFGNDVDAFRHRAARLNGRAAQFGDASYVFDAFPRIPVLAICSAGDDEVPPSSAILLDRSADHYLPVEDLSGVIGWVQQSLADG